jgi:N-acetylmuramoyl-L-alanine amidase
MLLAACAQSSASPRAGGEQATSNRIAARTPQLLLTPTRVTVEVLSKTDVGYRVRTPCGRVALVRGGTSLSDIDVLIDPGHGGSQTGAVANGIVEARLNIDVARQVRHELTLSGVRSALTRSGDYRLPLSTRVAMARRVRPKLFISIHHNGGPAAHHDGPGTEVYYQHRSRPAKRLAGLVWEEVFTKIGRFPAHWVGASDAGAIYRLNAEGDDYYGQLRLTPRTVSVLVEALYISEPSEAALLGTARFRAVEARAIAVAIKRYLHGDAQGSGFRTPLARPDEGTPSEPVTDCRDPRLE